MDRDKAARQDLNDLPVDPFELVGQGFTVASLTADHTLDQIDAPMCFCGPVHTHVRNG